MNSFINLVNDKPAGDFPGAPIKTSGSLALISQTPFYGLTLAPTLVPIPASVISRYTNKNL